MKRLFQLTLSVLLALTPALAVAQDLLSVTHGGLSISLSEKANGSFRVAIKTNQKSISTEILALENPSRLVVDVLDVKSNSSLSQTITHPLFTSLRIGVHPSKTRLVFDINHPRQPFFTENKNGNELIIDLGLPGISKPPVEAVEPQVEAPVAPTQVEPVAVTPAVEATPKEAPVVKEHTKEPAIVKEEPTPVAIEEEVKVTPPVEQKAPEVEAVKPVEAVEVETPEATTAAENEAVVEPIAPEATTETSEKEKLEVVPGIEEQDTSLESSDGGFFPETQERALIKDILFKRTQDRENAIAIQVENLGRYSFIKSAEQSYSLVIENAKAEEEENIMLTQFPPEGYQGIEAVTAYRKGKNIIVKVWVEKNVTLLPYRQGAELWIKAGK